jgi:signal transduction histidine kinase
VQADDVEAVIGLVNGAIEQVRSLARGLSPLEVVHRSLGSALKVLADDVASQFRLEVRLTAEIEDRVLTDLDADHLYRIVQEALVNAARHGGGQLIEVDVRVTQALLRVVVTDDGRGFANRKTNRDGLGLRMMRYRARHLGATVKMEAGEAGGARLVIAASRRG